MNPSLRLFTPIIVPDVVVGTALILDIAFYAFFEVLRGVAATFQTDLKEM